MPGVLKVTFKPPLRDLVGRFAKAEKALLDEKRIRVRVLGKRYIEIAQEEAPKKTGQFAKSLFSRTYETGNTVSFRAYSAQPLGRWIIEGTRPHIIRARNVGALYFFWSKGPRGPGMYSFRFVHHTGTKANPYHERAYRRWEPEVRPELRRIALRYISVLQGH